MATITLPCGRLLLLDQPDFVEFGDMPWKAVRADQKSERFYAYVWDRSRSTNAYIHRLILAPPPGLLVDHVSGDGLDNRRANIRIANRSQNNANRPAISGTGYRGVFQVESGKFKATISDRVRAKKCLHLGTFLNAEDAARAWDREARKRFGEFARLNFPTERDAA